MAYRFFYNKESETKASINRFYLIIDEESAEIESDEYSDGTGVSEQAPQGYMEDDLYYVPYYNPKDKSIFYESKPIETPESTERLMQNQLSELRTMFSIQQQTLDTLILSALEV